MHVIVPFSIAEQFGGADGLSNAVLEFSKAIEEHAFTVDVPAPVAPDLIELIVHQFGGKFEVEPEPEENGDAVPMLTKIPKDAIWRRATDAEAEMMETALQSQPVRLRRIYEGATFIKTDDELFAVLNGALTQMFGETRANELLEPTQ